MKIGRFEITSDKYQWILSEEYVGVDKDGNPKFHTRETYHGTLEQVCNTIVQREAKFAGDLAEVIEIISRTAAIIAEACNGIKKEMVK